MNKKIFLLLFVALMFLDIDSVFAAQLNESWGPGYGSGQIGYGWQQVYEIGIGEAASRLTGTADRWWYDYGFKEIQISSRLETYWSGDCGWWYVRGNPTINIYLYDAKGDMVLQRTNQGSTKGRNTTTYSWNSSDDDPGEWTARVDDGNVYSYFKLFVRGGLVVQNISTNASNGPYTPNTGENILVNVSLVDNAGNPVNGSYDINNGTSAAPNVWLYITGAGEEQNISMSDIDNDGNWTAVVTLNNMGDHKFIAKATDNHTYWVDGRGSVTVSVKGDFLPSYATDFASVLIPFLLYLRENQGPALQLLMFLVGVGVVFRRGIGSS